MGSPRPHGPHRATPSPPGDESCPRPPGRSSSTQPPNSHTPPPASRRPRLGPARSALACSTPGSVRAPPQPLGCHGSAPPTPQPPSPPSPPTRCLPSGLGSGPAPASGPAPETPPLRGDLLPPAPAGPRPRPRLARPAPPPPSPAPTRGPPSARGGGPERCRHSGRSRPLAAAARLFPRSRARPRPGELPDREERRRSRRDAMRAR